MLPRIAGLALALAAGIAAQAVAPARPEESVGLAAFVDHRDPPSYRVLSESEAAAADLGHAVFNTQWVVAGTPRAGRRDGLGPLFNAASCDECHNEGAHGRGPVGEGPAPLALVIQLDSPAEDDSRDAPGEPTYGHVLNTRSLPGVRAEGRVSIHYGPVEGHYPDGRPWHLRAPNYAITALRAGPLASGTIVRPRLAPALFGLGLLEAVPAEEIARPNTADPGEPAWRVRAGHRQIGRFGWQAITVSIREQTTRAFAREMGITSSDVPIDDCTPSEVDCLAQPNGGTPEVSPELLDALLAFQRWLAVPESPVHETYPEAERTFLQLGCASCHRPVLHPTLADASGHPVTVRIAPYTDLKVHDLGPELADRTVSGEIVRSRWRTAPLWGLGYRISREHFPTFLHDGRARSAEEAILWHKGEGSVAREAFENLPVEQRDRLLHWLETL